MIPLSGLQGGDTNLTCPQCQYRYDILEIEMLDPGRMSPNTYSPCGNCGGWFFPDNAVLETYSNLDDESGYITVPFSAGAGEMTNNTRTSIGYERTHKMSNLFEGYAFHIVRLEDVHRENVSQDEWLDLEPIGDSYSRAELGQAVIVSVDANDRHELSITADIRDNGDEITEVECGDEIAVQYAVSVYLDAVTDAPWIDLLRECKRAVHQDNLISAVPLLLSALDNALYRQVYTYYRWQGHGSEDAHQTIRDKFGNEDDDLYTKDLAKDALQDITGTSLSDARGPYGEEWHEFWGDEGVRSARNQIIHPDGGSLNEVGRNTVVEWFDLTMNLILGSYDLLRDYRYPQI